MTLNQNNLRFKIRLATAADCRAVWELANDPVVRAASFSSEPIPWEIHVNWFHRKLADANCLFYLAEDADSALVGQARYDIEARQAVVSIALIAAYRGKGYAAETLRRASRMVFESGAADLIRAYVKPDNAPSLRAFARAGFVENGSVPQRGIPAVEFILRGMSRSQEDGK